MHHCVPLCLMCARTRWTVCERASQAETEQRPRYWRTPFFPYRTLTHTCTLTYAIIRKRERRGAAVFAACTVSVGMKRQRRHGYRRTPRKGGREGVNSYTGTAAGMKQRNNLGRAGHGESESRERTEERGSVVQVIASSNDSVS